MIEGVGFLGNDRVGIEDCLHAIDTNGRLGNGVGRRRKVFYRLKELVEVCEVNG